MKQLKKSELDEYGVLRCRKGKDLIAFIYVYDGKEFVYVFNPYKKYRTEIEEIITQKRDNATCVPFCDWPDLGYDIGTNEDAICSVRETSGWIPEDGNDEQL